MYSIEGVQARAFASASAARDAVYAELAPEKKDCYKSLGYSYNTLLSDSQNDVQAIKQFSAKSTGQPVTLRKVTFDFSHKAGGWVVIPANITLEDCKLKGGQAAFASGNLSLMHSDTKALAVGEDAVVTVAVPYAYGFAANKGRAVGECCGANVCALEGGVAEAKQYVTFHAMGEGARCILDCDYGEHKLYVYDMLPTIGFDDKSLSTIEDLYYRNDITIHILNCLYCPHDVADEIKKGMSMSGNPYNFSCIGQNIVFPSFKEIKLLLKNYKDLSVNVVADKKGKGSFWEKLTNCFV